MCVVDYNRRCNSSACGCSPSDSPPRFHGSRNVGGFPPISIRKICSTGYCFFFSVLSHGAVLTLIFVPALAPAAWVCALQRILAQGSCQIDHAIEDLDGPEAFDTAMIMVEYENGKTAVIDVCRQAPYG